MERIRVQIPEFFKRCPSSQRRSPILQLAKCVVRVLNVSYETIITKNQRSARDSGWRTADSPGWVTFLPLAATQRATFSRSSAFPPFPSTARGVMASLPSHFAKSKNNQHSVLDRYNDNLPNSFAQFLTRLDGQAMMDLSMVGFPGCGDCLRSVQSKAIHCSVLPSPISSAMMQPY